MLDDARASTGTRPAANSRRTRAPPRCPVIVITAKDQRRRRVLATEVGADAFLSKPIDLPILLETLGRLTEPS